MLPKSLLAIFLVLLLNAPLLAATFFFAPQQSAAEAQTSNSTNRAPTAEALKQEGEQLLAAGEYGQARVKFLDAIHLWQQDHQTERAARALLQLADRDRQAARWQDSLECYRQLLQLKPLPGRTKAAALNSLAQVYAATQQFSFALEYHRQALLLAHRIKDQAEQVTALLGLAAVYTAQGRHTEARTRLQAAQGLERRAGNTPAEATTLQLMGRSYQEQRRWAKARQTLTRALTMQRQIGDQVGAAQSLCWLSETHLAMQQKQAALETADRAVKLAEALKNSAVLWRASLALARAHRALGHMREAIAYYSRAFGFIEKQRLTLSADALKIALLAEWQAPYRELADLLLASGGDEEAFNTIELSRARAMLDSLAQARRQSVSSPSPATNATLRELHERAAQLRAELRSPQLSREQRAQRQAELADTETDRLKHFIRPVTLEKAQEMMQHASSVMLEFCLGEPRSYVWLISAEETHWAVLPGQKKIEEQVRSYLKLLTSKPLGVHMESALAKQRKLGEQLFALLLGPLAERLKPDQRLVIVPDGLLYYLPFETLVSRGHYLIEDHEFSYAPSASTLSLLQQLSGRSSGEEQMELLAFGDPVFGTPAPTKAKGKLPQPKPTTNARWPPGRFSLPALPQTGAEVRLISEVFPPERQHIFMGAEATEAALKREPLDRYRRLHFATHSLIDEQFPARSGLLLTLDKDPAEDGFLEVAEIAELHLDCELVVLSACQTGRGQLVGGEGIVGLVRAFLYAGARSVVVSLWDASDVSTASLMAGFYHHLATRSDTAAALRQAKIEMLRGDQVTRHPYYWAPFVLVGQPQ